LKATRIDKDISEKFNGRAVLYELDEAVPYTKYNWESDEHTKEQSFYVVASAVVPMFGSGPETFLFPCDSEGNVLDWGELPGSFVGGLDPQQAIDGMVDYFNNHVDDEDEVDVW